MDALAELIERRDLELRLTPDRALETIDEAEEFLRDRGLLDPVGRLGAAEPLRGLPRGSVQARRPGGFGEWPATKWPWFGELADREGVYALKVHRGKHSS